jgi:hypothetical protein
VAFPNKWATILSLAPGGTFGLYDCKIESVSQSFKFNTQNAEFSPRDNVDLCIVAGETRRSAGPFMSRKLDQARCDKTIGKFKKWVIKRK